MTVSPEQSVIWFLAQDITRAYWLRRNHQPNEHGFCLGCASQVTPISSPCIILKLAEETIFRQIPLQRSSTDGNLSVRPY